MRLLHFHSSRFGDNPATDSLLIALGRSDSGAGDLFPQNVARRIRRVIRAGANLATQRLVGVDVDACHAYGRYLITRAVSRTRSNLFVFSTTPPDLPNSSPWRQKTKSASPLHPELGRGRNLHASAQAAPSEATAATGGVR